MASPTADMVTESHSDLEGSLSELTAHLSIDSAPPTQNNTFSQESQRKLSRCFEAWDNMDILMSEIEQIASRVPRRLPPGQSAIEYFETGADFLLSSLPRERLQALLTNTYASAAFSKGWHENDNTSGPSFENPPEAQPMGIADPGIYINCISPRSGIPLSRSQYDRLLDTLQLLLSGGDSGDLLQRMQGLWLEHHANISTGQHEEFSIGGVKAMHLMLWSHVFMQLGDVSEEIKYFPLPAEVRYSARLHTGMKEDRQLQSKNWITHTLLLTAKAIFPELDFVIHQFVLFRLTSPEQINVAKSVGGIITRAYGSHTERPDLPNVHSTDGLDW